MSTIANVVLMMSVLFTVSTVRDKMIAIAPRRPVCVTKGMNSDENDRTISMVLSRK